MGKNQVHVYNKSSFYQVRVTCDHYGEHTSRYINRNSWERLSYGCPSRRCGDWVTLKVYVYDNKGRTIKFLSYQSHENISWVIKSFGVVRQSYGQSLDSEDWSVKYDWNSDNENYYNEMDRQEAARREQQAREAREKAEKEARETREKAEKEAREAREKAEKEAREAEFAKQGSEHSHNASHDERREIQDKIVEELNSSRVKAVMKTQAVNLGYKTVYGKSMIKGELEFKLTNDLSLENEIIKGLESGDNKKILKALDKLSGMALSRKAQLAYSLLFKNLNKMNEELCIAMIETLDHIGTKEIENILIYSLENENILNLADKNDICKKFYFKLFKTLMRTQLYDGKSDNQIVEFENESEEGIYCIELIKELQLSIVNFKNAEIENSDISEDTFEKIFHLTLQKLELVPVKILDYVTSCLLKFYKKKSFELTARTFKFLLKVLETTQELKQDFFDITVEIYKNETKMDVCKVLLTNGMKNGIFSQNIFSLFETDLLKLTSYFETSFVVNSMYDYFLQKSTLPNSIFIPLLHTIVELDKVEICKSIQMIVYFATAETSEFENLMDEIVEKLKFGIFHLLDKKNDFQMGGIQLIAQFLNFRDILNVEIMKVLFDILNRSNEELKSLASEIMIKIARNDISLMEFIDEELLFGNIDSANHSLNLFCSVLILERIKKEIKMTNENYNKLIALVTFDYELSTLPNILGSISYAIHFEDLKDIPRDFIEICNKIFQKSDNEGARESACFALSEVIMKNTIEIDEVEGLYEEFKCTFFNWPNENMHAYSANALHHHFSKLVTANFITEENFFKFIEPSLMCSHDTISSSSSKVLGEYAKIFRGLFDEHNFKAFELLKSYKNGQKLLLKILGHALQFENSQIKEILVLIEEILNIEFLDKVFPLSLFEGLEFSIRMSQMNEYSIKSATLLGKLIEFDYKGVIERIDFLFESHEHEMRKIAANSVLVAGKAGAKFTESTVNHLVELINDPRNKLSVRDVATNALTYGIKNSPNLITLLSDKFQNIMENTDLRKHGIYALFWCENEIENEIGELNLENYLINDDPRILWLLGKKIEIENYNSEQCEEIKIKIDEICHSSWVSNWADQLPLDALEFIKRLNKNANNLLKTESVDEAQKLKLRILIAKGEIAKSTKNFSQAISFFDKSLKMAEKCNFVNDYTKFTILSQLGEVYRLFKSPKASIKCLKSALAIRPNVKWIQVSIAKALTQFGKFEASTNLYESLATFRNEYLSIIVLNEKFSELHAELIQNCGKEVAKSQIKTIVLALENKSSEEAKGMIDYLLELDEYYDLTVASSWKLDKWKIQFTLSEIIGRAAGASETDIEDNLKYLIKFNESWKILEKYHENDQVTLETVLILLNNCKKPSGWNIEMAAQILIFFQVPLSPLPYIMKKETWFEELKCEWLREQLKKHNQQISNEDLELFIEDFDDSCLKSEIQLTEQFIEESLKSNTINEIHDFISYMNNNAVPVSVIKSISNPLNKDNNVSLMKWKQNDITLRLDKEIQNIWGNSENANLIRQFLIQMFNDGSLNIKNFETLKQKFLNIDEGEKDEARQSLLNALSVFYSYRINEKKEFIESVNEFWNEDSANWMNKMNSIARESYYTLENVDKDVETLINELIEENKNLEPIIQNLEAVLQEIETQFLGFSSIINHEIKICEWGYEDLQSWAKLVRGNISIAVFTEIIAVIERGIQLHCNYRPRKIGLMSLIILLKTENHGRISKIATGEGKSSIVAMLTAYKIFEGYQVDVITSSPVLAQRDAEEWSGFYNSLGITVMDNSAIQIEHGIMKSCYSQDVVYGDPSTFQGDVLRHEFNLMNTRGSRCFSFAIIDEVDSMFIDNSNHSTRLIDKMPAMEYLEPVFVTIYSCVQLLISSIIPIDGKPYSITEPFGKTNQLIAAISKCSELDALAIKRSENLVEEIQKFAFEMMNEEINNAEFRTHIAKLLKNSEMKLSPKILTLIESNDNIKQIKQEDEIVTEFIKDKWNLSFSYNILNVLEIYLGINIFVHDIIDKELELSPEFHTDYVISGEIEERKTNIRFFITEGQLYYLKFIPGIEQFIQEGALKQMRGLVSTGKSNNENTDTTIKIPKHLSSLFDTKLDEWIGSAIKAQMQVSENRDYLLKKPDDGTQNFMTITPIDFSSTGVLQNNTVWGDGLHQFLQIKHKLRITPEYLATNFLSNMEFFKRYKNNLYGLTGTIGHSAEEQLLKQIYNVDTVNIPSFKPKQKLELKPIVSMNRKEWLLSIVNSIRIEIRSNRAILLICKTIQDTVDIEEFLKESLKDENVSRFISYTRSDDQHSAKQLETVCEVRTIVFATNLAGRGTDIKLSKEVVANGGLHVCITFLPSNLRVEEQAAGRSARKGEPGTFQLILNIENDLYAYKDSTSLNIEKIKTERDENETSRVELIINKLSRELEIENKQFKKYCSLRSELKSNRFSTKNIKDNVLDAISERWALQLEDAKTRHDILDWDKIDLEFDSFFNNMRNEYYQGAQSTVYNPSYAILEGNASLLRNKWDNAVSWLNHAIWRDEIFAYNAFYNRAYCYINDEVDDYREKASKDLKTCAELIQRYMLTSLIQIHNLVETKCLSGNEGLNTIRTNSSDTDFTKQIINKVNFYYLQLKSIEEAFKKMDEIKGDFVAKFKTVEEYYRDKNEPICEDEIDEFRESGFIQFIYIEKKPVPWWAIFVVFILGAIQVIAGAALAICTGGAFGTGLISEGVSDIILGIKVACGEDFSFNDYIKQKGISIAIGLVMAVVGPAIAAVTRFVTSAISKAINVVTKVVTKFTSKMSGSVIGNVMSKSFTFMKAVGTSLKNGVKAAWNWTKNTMMRIRDKIVNFGKKLFGKLKLNFNLGLSNAAKENLKNAGRLIFTEAFEQGMFVAVDYGVIKPVSEAIEKKLLSDLIDKFNDEMNGEIGNRIDLVFKSCQGKEFFLNFKSRSIKILMGESNRENHWDTVRSKVAGVIQTEVRDMQKQYKKQRITRNIYVRIFEEVVANIDTIFQVKEYIEAMAELSNMVSEFIEVLNSELKEIEENLKDHEESEEHSECSDEQFKFVENIPQAKRDLVETWATMISEKMRGLIESQILTVPIKLGVSELTSKLTKKNEFMKKLKKDFESKRAQIISKNVSEKNSFDKPTENDKSTMREIDKISDKESFDSLAGIVGATNHSIEIFTLGENDEVKYDKTFGKIGDNSPIRLLYTPKKENDDGSFIPSRFDPMILDSNSNISVVNYSNMNFNESRKGLYPATLHSLGLEVNAENVEKLKIKSKDEMIRIYPVFAKHFMVNNLLSYHAVLRDKILGIGETYTTNLNIKWNL